MYHVFLSHYNMAVTSIVEINVLNEDDGFISSREKKNVNADISLYVRVKTRKAYMVIPGTGAA